MNRWLLIRNLYEPLMYGVEELEANKNFEQRYFPGSDDDQPTVPYSV